MITEESANQKETARKLDEGMGCGLKTHARSSPRLTPEVLSKRFFGRDEEYKEGGGGKNKGKGFSAFLICLQSVGVALFNPQRAKTPVIE